MHAYIHMCMQHPQTTNISVSKALLKQGSIRLERRRPSRMQRSLWRLFHGVLSYNVSVPYFILLLSDGCLHCLTNWDACTVLLFIHHSRLWHQHPHNLVVLLCSCSSLFWIWVIYFDSSSLVFCWLSLCWTGWMCLHLFLSVISSVGWWQVQYSYGKYVYWYTDSNGQSLFFLFASLLLIYVCTAVPKDVLSVQLPTM